MIFILFFFFLVYFSVAVKMENTSEEDDRFSIVCGDLGLGENTRKSYLNCELMNLGHCHSTLSVSDSCLNSHLKGLNYGSDLHSISSKECGANIWERKFVSCDHSCETLLSTEPLVTTNTNTTNLGVQGMGMEVFPTYADVPYGTSLRQQKKLFEQQIDTLRRQFAASLSSDTTASGFKKQNWGMILLLVLRMKYVKSLCDIVLMKCI